MRASVRQAREQAAAERAARAASYGARTESKWVRSADEDDDRRRVVDGAFEYANPRYRARPGHGWHCAFNLRRSDLAEVPPEAGCAGFFEVVLRPHDAGWRIRCNGTDGAVYARDALDAATARRVYASIQPLTTVRTLLRRGFRRD